MKSSLSIVSLILLCLIGTGCGVLIGNVKPTDEKSENYGFMDLAKENSDWIRLEADADVAFQSQQTASIISINSSCRVNQKRGQADLHRLTNLLFLGFSDIISRQEENLVLEKNIPALQTTIRGKLNGDEMMLRVVVLRQGYCVYDLLYMARPDFFHQHESAFSHFIASLRLKE